MSKSNRKRVSIIFTLALLFSSMLLVNLKLPAIAQSEELIYLHGPSLAPIHMHGPPLMPVHMHSTIGIIDLANPMYTPWHELYPKYCENWVLTSWEDNGNQILDSSDQIDMTNGVTQQVRWYHVDRITITLKLWNMYNEEIYVEFKGPYDPYIQPICTLWHEVWPVYHGVFGPGNPYHIVNWQDTGIGNTGYLGVCDSIEFGQWPGLWWHVEEYATDLILNEKVMNPLGIEWHELYPNFCNHHLTTSWEEPLEDLFPGRLSPGDQVDMINQASGITGWYHVDRVTFTMKVTNESDPTQEMYIEYKGPFETMYNIKTTVVNSTWHEVYPFYSVSMNITSWIDNCNGVLDSCDYIEMYDLNIDFYYGWWHVEELSIDLILNKKVDNPTGIIWHELHPDCCINDYNTLSWEDNFDGLLNPCDNVTLALLPIGPTDKYHVENMTLTLNLTVNDVDPTMPFTIGERIYIEYLDATYYDWKLMYYSKTNPLYTGWEVVCPTDRFGYPITIEKWYDNCNGILSYFDIIELQSSDGTMLCLVDELALDITVKKITEEHPPPPSWYMKPPFPDYAPSGMPDFDQRQVGTYPWMDPSGRWSHCGPTAVANSILWLDSKFEPNTIPPPTIIDNYPLVQAYGPWDDHDSQNVQPLVEHLAYLMDTNGLRTGIVKLGTNVFDMQAGLTHYLSWTGVNPLGDVDGDGIVTQNDQAIVLNAMGTSPGTPGWEIRADIFPVTVSYPPITDNIIDINDLTLVQMNMGLSGMFYEHTMMAPPWELIADEVMRCQDVVLLIAPWYYDGVNWYRYDEGAHYVTVAGLNATTWEIVLSDPINDNAEVGGPGSVPVPHVHPPPEPPYITHNKANLVSHDMYKVIMQPCPGGPLAIIGYPGSIVNPPGTIWQIEAAVITCPYAVDVHDIAVTNVTTSKSGCLPMPTICENYTATVDVTILNEGDFTENVTVTAYANSTVIGTQAYNNLAPTATATLTFVWNTTGFVKGNYSISAYAWPVLGETHTADNTFTDGWVIVVIVADINGDGSCDMADISIMIDGFMATPSTSAWNPNADVNDDGSIDMADISIAIDNFMKTDP
ncbi:MAG: dockerin type I domain-containing protein [Candidatus Bathyarchaeia archaeon]